MWVGGCGLRVDCGLGPPGWGRWGGAKASLAELGWDKDWVDGRDRTEEVTYLTWTGDEGVDARSDGPDRHTQQQQQQQQAASSV